MKKVLFNVVAAACVTLCMISSVGAQGNAAKGKDLYNAYTCYGCHGDSGQNGPGARLVPMKMAQIAFTAYVRSPRTNQMPSFSTKVLTDTQLGDIWAYVKTLPDSPAAKDIKLLQDIKAEIK